MAVRYDIQSVGPPKWIKPDGSLEDAQNPVVRGDADNEMSRMLQRTGVLPMPEPYTGSPRNYPNPMVPVPRDYVDTTALVCTTLEQASIYTPTWGMTTIITSYRQEGRTVHFHPRCDTKTLELREVAQIAQKERPELNFASAKYETHDLFRIEMITIFFLLYIRIEKNRIQKTIYYDLEGLWKNLGSYG